MPASRVVSSGLPRDLRSLARTRNYKPPWWCRALVAFPPSSLRGAERRGSPAFAMPASRVVTSGLPRDLRSLARTRNYKPPRHRFLPCFARRPLSAVERCHLVTARRGAPWQSSLVVTSVHSSLRGAKRRGSPDLSQRAALSFQVFPPK